MRLKISLLLCLSFLASSCAHGPIVTVWVSDPVNTGAFVYTPKQNAPAQVLQYSASSGYAVYPPESFQALVDYCAARNAVGTQAPALQVCSSSVIQAGFLCHPEECAVNTTSNGLICKPNGPDELTLYAESNDFIALSPPDQTTLLVYCNISLGEK